MDYSNIKEKDLIKKSQRGDTKAFEEIMFRDAEHIFAWILQQTKSRHLTEELFQITLIKCWKNIKKFKGNSTCKTWACAIARNLFIDDYRKKQRRKEESLDDEEDYKKRDRAIVEFDPLKNFKNKELGSFLDEIMDKLSSTHKNVLYYFAVEGLSYEEISKIEKCSVGTVMSRLFYARKKAQDLIQRNKNSKLYYGDD